MMARWKLMAVLVCSVGLTACKKADDTMTAPPTAAVPDAPALPSADAAKPAMSNAAANTRHAAGDAVAGAQTGMANMMSSAKDAAGNMQAQATGASTTADASSKLNGVAQAIHDKKYDVADALLKQVEAKKGSLPQSMQNEVAGLRANLDAAKATE